MEQLEMGETYEMPECVKQAFPQAPETAELVLLHWDEEDQCYLMQLKPVRKEVQRRFWGFYEGNSQN